MEKNTIKELEKKVNQYKNGSIPSEFDFLSTKKIYFIIPVIILLLLIILRPGFLYVSETPTSARKLSTQKIFISWFIISLILVLAIYAYNFKHNYL